MPTHTLECELLVKRSLEETFAFFQNPANLSRITPPWLKFEMATKNAVMAEGAQFDYTIRWLGLGMKWRSLISRYDPPHSFVDEQVIGPYKTWRHEHTFVETKEGVLARDHLQYSLPLGPFGEVAQWVMVKRQLLEVFRFRQQELDKVFQGKTASILQPAIT